MDGVTRATLSVVGVGIVLAAIWLMPRGVPTQEVAALAKKLDDLERRVDRLEHRKSDVAAAPHTSPAVALDRLQEDIARLEARLASLAHPRPAPDISASPGIRVPEQAEVPPSDIRDGARSAEIRIPSGQLERLVTDVVASLAPRYLEEQVSELYAAQKKADEEAQREAEQRRAQEGRERRLANMLADLHAFVPGLSAFQDEEVARIISEQWDMVAAMRRQAWDAGTVTAPGEILRRARELTDEKLYGILNRPQLEAFHYWRETRFGAPESLSR
ncbi:MAG: hypothetical protein HYZ81_18395 [Nitrospinae bacterium]|nr:hypothetical protein [Nitrospinota bacterium]